MGSILTPAALASRWQAATVAFNTLFQQTLTEVKPEYEAVTTVLPSDTREEDLPWLDRLPRMREFLGERRVNNVSLRMQTLVNKKYEDTLGIKREDLEDDKIGVYAPAIKMLAQQAALNPEYLVTDVMQAGGTSVVYDNQYFFDTDHPVNMDDPSVTGPSGSNTQANLLTSHPLTSANYQDAYQTMTSFVGADGKPLKVRPTLLVVPPQLRFQTRRVLQAELIGTDITLASSPSNPQLHGAAAESNVNTGSAEVFVWDQLAAEPTTWYLLCTIFPVKPFVYLNRIPPEFAYLTKPEDHNVFMRDEFLYGVRARGVAGYGPWFLAIKCTA